MARIEALDAALCRRPPPGVGDTRSGAGRASASPRWLRTELRWYLALEPSDGGEIPLCAWHIQPDPCRGAKHGRVNRGLAATMRPPGPRSPRASRVTARTHGEPRGERGMHRIPLATPVVEVQVMECDLAAQPERSKDARQHDDVQRINGTALEPRDARPGRFELEPRDSRCDQPMSVRALPASSRATRRWRSRVVNRNIVAHRTGGHVDAYPGTFIGAVADTTRASVDPGAAASSLIRLTNEFPVVRPGDRRGT